jgi:hypothetical protein
MAFAESATTAILDAFDGCCGSPTRRSHIKLGTCGRTGPETGNGKTRPAPSLFPGSGGRCGCRHGDTPQFFCDAKTVRPLAPQHSQFRFRQPALSVESSGPDAGPNDRPTVGRRAASGWRKPAGFPHVDTLARRVDQITFGENSGRKVEGPHRTYTSGLTPHRSPESRQGLCKVRVEPAAALR